VRHRKKILGIAAAFAVLVPVSVWAAMVPASASVGPDRLPLTVTEPFRVSL
jgi:hypothetical protein